MTILLYFAATILLLSGLSALYRLTTTKDDDLLKRIKQDDSTKESMEFLTDKQVDIALSVGKTVAWVFGGLLTIAGFTIICYLYYGS